MYGVNIILFLISCQLANAEVSSRQDIYRDFQRHWQAHRKSFENAILLALKENYGYRGMNVFVRRSADSLRLSKGFLVTDNAVELLLLDMALTSLPHITMPEVTFALASNVLHLEAELSKMIVESRYILFRNKSNILYQAAQDPYRNSPFIYQQVENVGHVTIIAEDCSLTGYILVKLSGHSINLGHDTFEVKNCKFSVEISPYGYGYPPVIAPYFSPKQGKQLELLLTRPVREELIPKLQAAVFSYINTSVVFGDYLSKFREHQNILFKETMVNITNLVRDINENTIESVGETANLEPLQISWNPGCQSGSCVNHISLHNVILHGLDTLYASHLGGPYKLQTPSVGEAFRFNSILVRGSGSFNNKTLKIERDFVADIKDLEVNFESSLNKTDPTFTFKNWRTIDISVSETDTDLGDKRASEALVTGYLLNVLPVALEKHLFKVFEELISTMQKLHNIDVKCNNG